MIDTARYNLQNNRRHSIDKHAHMEYDIGIRNGGRNDLNLPFIPIKMEK